MSQALLGTILTILWTLYVTVGFVSQIIKNKKNKSFGWSKVLFLLAYTTYIVGPIYGFVKMDYYIFIPYIVGFVFLNVLLYQFFKYQNGK